MNSIKEDEAKIKKIEKELEKLQAKYAGEKEKNKEQRKSINSLKQRIRELIKSRDSWKSKLKDKQLEIMDLKTQISRQGKAKWHPYD